MLGFWQFPVNITIFTFLIHLLQRRWRVWGRLFEERGLVGGAQHDWGRFLGSVISQSACADTSSGLDGASWSAQRQCGGKSLQTSASWKSFAQRAPFFSLCAGVSTGKRLYNPRQCSETVRPWSPPFQPGRSQTSPVLCGLTPLRCHSYTFNHFLSFFFCCKIWTRHYQGNYNTSVRRKMTADKEKKRWAVLV